MRTLEYDTIKKDGRIKPKLNYIPDQERLTLPLKPGEPVIFDRNLLHYGVSHKADYTRVSIEFAIEVSEKHLTVDNYSFVNELENV